MMWRPRDTNSYTITREKESQTGIDSLTQVQNYAQATIQKIRDPASLNIMGEPGYMEIESISPARDALLRQGSRRAEDSRARETREKKH